MARNEIKFYGSFDVSKIESQTKKLSQSVESAFGKSGVPIIDKSNLKFLQGEAQNGIRAVTAEMKRLQAEAIKYDREMTNSSKNSKEHNVLARQRLEITKQMAVRERQLADIQRQSSRLQKANQGALGKMIPFQQRQDRLATTRQGVGGNVIDAEFSEPGMFSRAKGALGRAGRGIMGATGTVARSLPGVGAAAGAAVSGAGAIMTGGPVMGGLIAAAGMAAVAIGRMAAASEAYVQQVPQILKLNAMGQAEASGIGRQTAVQLGYNPNETFAAQEALTRSFGMTTQQGSENRLANTMLFSRRYGMDPQQLAGMGNQLRAVGGQEFASKQMAEMMNKAITKGLDASQMSNFMEATTGLLAQINENGLMSTAGIVSAMADLVNKGLAPEQAAKVIGSMNQAIKGATGESATFFQQAAARGGLGGGSIFGAQQAMMGGLTGVNLDKLTKTMSPEMAGRVRDAYGQFGLGGGGEYTANFAGGILEQLNTIAPGDEGSSLLYKGQVAADMFGAGSAAEGLEIVSVLEKMSKGKDLTQGEKEIIENLNKDPEAKWRDEVRDYLRTMAMATASRRAGMEFTKIDLGKASQGIMAKLDRALTALDKTLIKFLSSDTFASLMKGLEKAGDMLGTAWNKITKMLGGMGDALAESIGTLMTDPAKFGEELATGITDALTGFYDKMKELITSLIDAIPSVSKTAKGFMDTAGEVISGFTGGGDMSDKAAQRSKFTQKMASEFKAMKGGEQIEDDAVAEFQGLIAAYRNNRSDKVKDERMEEFIDKQADGLGGLGKNELQEAMLRFLQQVANNTKKRPVAKVVGAQTESTAVPSD